MTCPQCGAQGSFRTAARYPVALQILFALSFVAFLLLYEKIREATHSVFILWTWSGIQIVLGVGLALQRIRAGRRTFRCHQCGSTIR